MELSTSLFWRIKSINALRCQKFLSLFLNLSLYQATHSHMITLSFSQKRSFRNVSNVLAKMQHYLQKIYNLASKEQFSTTTIISTIIILMMISVLLNKNIWGKTEVIEQGNPSQLHTALL